MKKIELLPPQNLATFLQKRLSELNNALSALRLRRKSEVSGSLRVAHNKNTLQFYWHNKNEASSDKYIPKSNTDLIKSLSQKAYDSKMEVILLEEIKSLTEYLQNLQKTDSQKADIYSVSPDRLPFITPLTLSDEDFARQWQEFPYKSKPVQADIKTYKTARGEVVRSKSEVIIADTLFRYNVPYRYEYPVKMKLFPDGIPLGQSGIGNTVNYYPDFFCVNLRTRQEIIWEHFGLMNNTEYSENAAAKMNNYALNGWLNGVNLISTWESENVPLSTEVVELMIKTFLI